VVLCSELVQGIVDRKQLIVFAGGGNLDLVDVHPALSSTVTLRAFAPGALDQDASHRLGCGAEEVGAILPRSLVVFDQPQPGFMNEGRRLQGVAGGFVGHPVGRQLTQFLIHQRQQLIRGLFVALLHTIEDVRDVVHQPGILM
jgi:hypothetical protein